MMNDELITIISMVFGAVVALSILWAIDY